MITALLNELVEVLWTLLLLVTIHELGHFAAAYYFGLPVSSMEVGVGPRLFSFEWKGMQFRWYALPICGELRTCWLSKRKWKNVMLFLAGPLTNVVFACIMFAVAGNGPMARGSLAFGLINLIPFRTKTIDSDGYQILQALRK